jgi:hypothetical protein
VSSLVAWAGSSLSICSTPGPLRHGGACTRISVLTALWTGARGSWWLRVGTQVLLMPVVSGACPWCASHSFAPGNARGEGRENAPQQRSYGDVRQRVCDRLGKRPWTMRGRDAPSFYAVPTHTCQVLKTNRPGQWSAQAAIRKALPASYRRESLRHAGRYRAVSTEGPDSNRRELDTPRGAPPDYAEFRCSVEPGTAPRNSRRHA